jgi:hypothetical protein
MRKSLFFNVFDVLNKLAICDGIIYHKRHTHYQKNSKPHNSFLLFNLVKKWVAFPNLGVPT